MSAQYSSAFCDASTFRLCRIHESLRSRQSCTFFFSHARASKWIGGRCIFHTKNRWEDTAKPSCAVALSMHCIQGVSSNDRLHTKYTCVYLDSPLTSCWHNFILKCVSKTERGNCVVRLPLLPALPTFYLRRSHAGQWMAFGFLRKIESLEAVRGQGSMAT